MLSWPRQLVREMVYPYGHPSWTNHRCEKLAQSFYAVVPCRDSNPRPLDRESDALPLHHHATNLSSLIKDAALSDIFTLCSNADAVVRWAIFLPIRLSVCLSSEWFVTKRNERNFCPNYYTMRKIDHESSLSFQANGNEWKRGKAHRRRRKRGKWKETKTRQNKWKETNARQQSNAWPRFRFFPFDSCSTAASLSFPFICLAFVRFHLPRVRLMYSSWYGQYFNVWLFSCLFVFYIGLSDLPFARKFVWACVPVFPSVCFWLFCIRYTVLLAIFVLIWATNWDKHLLFW